MTTAADPCSNKANPDYPRCRETSRDALADSPICSWCGRGAPGRVQR